jgi:cytochrome c peroxidase
MYQKLGLVKEYDTKDMGRFAVTKQEADKKFFKVPSLRNVAKTGPYFHDGSVKTLDQAVSIMAEYQLGKQLSKEEVTDIVAFLGSLTGDTSKYVK